MCHHESSSGRGMIKTMTLFFLSLLEHKLGDLGEKYDVYQGLTAQ
jgi:hypothetical protein